MLWLGSQVASLSQNISDIESKKIDSRDCEQFSLENFPDLLALILSTHDLMKLTIKLMQKDVYG